MKTAKWVLVLFALVGLTGCISANSYVDPQFRKASYDDIKPVLQRHAVNLEVEFQRNGKHLPSVDRTLRISVEQSFRATGVVTLDSSTPTTIKVIVNNVVDMGEAIAKGFGTGASFGAIGSVVQDFYEVTIEFKPHGGGVVKKSYKHAIHTTIGNKPAPFPDVGPTNVNLAFNIVVEDIVLNFVKDMQADKLLSLNGSVNPDKTAAVF